MKILIGLVTVLVSLSSLAGGRVTWAVPTQVDLERGNGIMVYGAFGNPNECTISDKFYIPNTHPEYEKYYGLVMTAFTTNKEIRAYAHSCKPVAWYTVPSTTYNSVDTGDISIRN